tara:strand:+ start:225 stop:1469 length:1245 start_codon:yes stop_codon:yes gene_type:complete
MKILVLGGGVVGVTTAYYLLKDGHQVTVIDRQAPAMGGASFGNAGLIAPGHAYAWASPKALKTLLQSIIYQDPTFKMSLRPDWQLMVWGLKFLRECNTTAVKRNGLAKHRLCTYSQHILGKIVEETGVQYCRNSGGALYLFRSPETLEAGIANLQPLIENGQKMEVLDFTRVAEIDPTLAHMQDRISGAVFSPTDESGNSFLFTVNLWKVCTEMGGTFEDNTTIERIESSGDQIERVMTNRGERKADLYVLCLGSWSPLLVRPLGVRLSIYPVKGYSITLPVEDGHTPPTIGGIDEDFKIAYSNLGDKVRLTSVAEFIGYDTTHSPKDFDYLLQSAHELFPNAGNYDKAEYWAGLRPMTPDSLPILDTALHSNLYFNTGHGHMGWTMACGTARLTSDLIAKRTPEISVDQLRFR